MDSLFNIVLSSAVVAALVKGIEQNQVNKLNMITSKRGDWRKELKDIALDIKKSNVDNINEYLTQLKINLNYYGSVNCKNKKDEDLDIVQDEHIWKVIYEIEDYCANEQEDIEKFEEYKKRLIDYIGLLLKFDWDRSKYETNSAFDFMSSIIFLLAVGVGGVLLYYWQNPKMTIYEIISDGMVFVLPSLIMLIPLLIKKMDSQICRTWYKNIDYFKIAIVCAGIMIIFIVIYFYVIYNQNGVIIAIAESLYMMSIAYPVLSVYKEKKFYMKYEKSVSDYIDNDNRKLKNSEKQKYCSNKNCYDTKKKDKEGIVMKMNENTSKKELDSIIDGVNTKFAENDLEERMKQYIISLKKSIGDDRNKYLAYKSVLEKEMDLNFPGFWMATLALFISAVSLVIDNISGQEIIKTIVSSIAIVAIILGILYYTVVNEDRKKYQPVLIALNEIERERANEENKKM